MMKNRFGIKCFKGLGIAVLPLGFNLVCAMEQDMTCDTYETQSFFDQNTFMTLEDQARKDNFLRYQKQRAPYYGLITLDMDTPYGTSNPVMFSSFDDFINSLNEQNVVKSEEIKEVKERIKKDGFIAISGLKLCVVPMEIENQPRYPSDYFATLRKNLSAELYHIANPGEQKVQLSIEDYLAWALSGYEYQFGKSTWTPVAPLASMIVPNDVKTEVEILAHVTTVFRDSIRARTNQYTPNVGASLMCDLAQKYGASIEVIMGDRLKKEFEAVYEVGKGSKDKPNVTVLTWSHPNPVLTLDLVGKGVCFDTGGNNLKTDPNGMYMDKGGALAQNALAEIIMAMNLPIKLRLGNAWVVNSPGGEATNTNDIYTIGGKTVENKNTDAEGRLIMAPVLAYFANHNPAEVTQTQATLTGSALVGYGSNTAVVYSSNKIGERLINSMNRVADPAWRGPRDTRYLKDMKQTDADLGNMGASYGGSSFADQFLCQFAAPTTEYIHIDSACAIKGSTGITPTVTSGDLFGVRGTYEFLKEIIANRTTMNPLDKLFSIPLEI